MQNLINTEILMDIITDHDLCDTQKRELMKTIERLNYNQPVIYIGFKKKLNLLFKNNGLFGYEAPFGTTLEQAEKIASKKGYKFDEFDVDTYEINNYGGMKQIDRKRYDKTELSKISKELLLDYKEK